MSSVDVIIFGLPQRFIPESFSEREGEGEREGEIIIKITVAHSSMIQREKSEFKLNL